jgi:hypothetical protein
MDKVHGLILEAQSMEDDVCIETLRQMHSMVLDALDERVSDSVNDDGNDDIPSEEPDEDED